MTEHLSLTNQFLIAMPALDDPNFHGTVTFICEHNDQGAMGIVINRPLTMTLGEILEQMDIPSQEDKVGRQMVYMGGPVQTDRGFVLHNPVGDFRSLVALGYAGWGAGQLEQELADNVWLCGPANNSIIFDTPWQQRWEAAAALMGVDLNQISDQIGHA